MGHRLDLDLALLWLWCGPAAVVLIRSLAWELPYASGAALKIYIYITTRGAILTENQLDTGRKTPRQPSL